MLLALLTDIHANREAFDACRAEALRLGAQRFVYLGDFVGYGADPSYIVDRIAEDVAAGALAIMGNHDLAAVTGDISAMHEVAGLSAVWTRTQLDERQVGFLQKLPYTAKIDDLLFVHGDSSAPERFIYVRDEAHAERALRAVKAHVVFCGHVHRPQLYHLAPERPAHGFHPKTNVKIPLARSQQWLAVLGAVGQPRDDNPLAAFALYDTARESLTFVRTPYDIAAAAYKIEQAGLPEILAQRLFVGL